MSRPLHKLSARKVASIVNIGRHSDGGNLYFVVTERGRKWTFLYRNRTTGNQHEMGLGAYPAVSLKAARENAAYLRQVIDAGSDPLASRSARKTTINTPTFEEAADNFIRMKGAVWANPKHKKQWTATIHTHAGGLLKKRVDQITQGDILAVLEPIWITKTETASRLRGRIERILDDAKVRGYRSGDNPARWKGNLDSTSLPQPEKLKRGHFAAMPYREIPKLMARLRANQSIGARALEFVILTASRSGQVVKSKRDGQTRGARFDEIDRKAGIWTVPPERMKGRKGHSREHCVPLSARALAIVAEMAKGQWGPFVFPGQNRNEPVSNMTLEATLRRMDLKPFTVHGFRSSFTDWAHETTNFPSQVIEKALAHTIADKVEAAYRRGALFDKRRELMSAWANYCGQQSAKKR